MSWVLRGLIPFTQGGSWTNHGPQVPEKARVVGPLPNGRFMGYIWGFPGVPNHVLPGMINSKWGWGGLTIFILQIFRHSTWKKPNKKNPCLILGSPYLIFSTNHNNSSFRNLERKTYSSHLPHLFVNIEETYSLNIVVNEYGANLWKGSLSFPLLLGLGAGRVCSLLCLGIFGGKDHHESKGRSDL